MIMHYIAQPTTLLINRDPHLSDTLQARSIAWYSNKKRRRPNLSHSHLRKWRRLTPATCLNFTCFSLSCLVTFTTVAVLNLFWSFSYSNQSLMAILVFFLNPVLSSCSLVILSMHSFSVSMMAMSISSYSSASILLSRSFLMTLKPFF